MKKSKIILLVITMIITVTCCLTGCASCDRAMKDMQSDINGGLRREIIVYDCVGNKLYEYTGKFDVDYSDERVLFDDENGNRHAIYFKSGTVIINEVE